MPPRDNGDLARVLLERARADRALVSKVVDDDEITDGIVGFHAQQAVEKAIKAVLASHSVSFMKTHALGYLINLVEESGIEAPPALQRADELAPWAVEFRYESDKAPALDRRSALALVDELLSWAEAAVGP